MRYLTKTDDLYRTKEWKQLKNKLMHDRANAEGVLVCEYCGKPILHEWDCIPHHYKIPVTFENMNNADITLDEDNLMLVHFKCHNELENRFCKIQRKVILVHGNICSGKTTFVKENATKDDLVLDIDNIWQMISINERYIKPSRLKPIVFALWNDLLEQVKMRSGTWVNAYVITANPRVLDRKRLMNEIGVTDVVHIDTPVEECLERLYQDEKRISVREEYERYILNYAQSFQKDE